MKKKSFTTPQRNTIFFLKKLDLPELPHDYGFSHGLGTLGRVLFYDTKLSSTEEISCASCHKQEIAFSDDVAFSHGVNGVTTRNSIGLFGGVAYYSAPNSFFWDERAKRMEDQPGMTISNTIEMDMTLTKVAERLRQDAAYPILFKKAFGDSEIDEDRITQALVHFVRSITTNESKYDEELNKNGFFVGPETQFSGYTSAENLGMKLYQNNCASCHGNTLSPLVATANNGLDEVYEDKGVGEVSFDVRQNGVFKVPLIRNVELTAPYMHDGRFETLEEVIDFYSEGIQSHENLHANLRNSDGSAKNMDFSREEKQALVAFLKTLTDHELAKKEKYADPFK